MFLPNVTWPTAFARLVAFIATSTGTDFLIMAVFGYDRDDDRKVPPPGSHNRAPPLCQHRSRPHSRQKLLMQSSTTSGVSSIFLKCPSCPGCPPGFNPLFARRVFVRRITSSFIRSLDGGTLLLQEFLSGSSCTWRCVCASRGSPSEACPRCASDRRFQYAARQMVSRIDCTSFVRLSKHWQICP